jgi:hypothetical protein
LFCVVVNGKKGDWYATFVEQMDGEDRGGRASFGGRSVLGSGATTVGGV